MTAVIREIQRVLLSMIADWSSLNESTKNAFVNEAINSLAFKGFYEIPSDITTTGKKYFLEPYEVGLNGRGA